MMTMEEFETAMRSLGTKVKSNNDQLVTFEKALGAKITKAMADIKVLLKQIDLIGETYTSSLEYELSFSANNVNVHLNRYVVQHKPRYKISIDAGSTLSLKRESYYDTDVNYDDIGRIDSIERAKTAYSRAKDVFKFADMCQTAIKTWFEWANKNASDDENMLATIINDDFATKAIS